MIQIDHKKEPAQFAEQQCSHQLQISDSQIETIDHNYHTMIRYIPPKSLRSLIKKL